VVSGTRPLPLKNRLILLVATIKLLELALTMLLLLEGIERRFS